MDEKQQVEKTATDVFNKLRLKWVVASVEQDRHSHEWAVEVQVPEGSELILTVPNGTPREIKNALMEQAEEEMDRLSSHK